MPMPSAWSPTLPDEVILNAAVLDYESGVATRTVVGMAEGGHNFISGEERRHITADGIRTNILGLRRVLRWVDTRFEGRFKQIPLSTMAKYLPGATVTAAGTPLVTTYVPAPAGHVLVAGDLYLKPRLNWAMSDGGWLYVEFPYGEIAEFPNIEAPDLEEGRMPYRMLAVVDPDAVGWTPDSPPFTVVHNAPAASP